MSEICRTCVSGHITAVPHPHTPIGVGCGSVFATVAAPLPHLKCGKCGNLIPQSVLDLIAAQWPDTSDGVWSTRYLYRPDDGADRRRCGLRYAEVRALVDDGILTNDWRGGGAGVAVLGHELEALRAFCAEMQRQAA